MKTVREDFKNHTVLTRIYRCSERVTYTTNELLSKGDKDPVYYVTMERFDEQEAKHTQECTKCKSKKRA